MESSNLVFVLKLCYKDRQREYSLINSKSIAYIFRVHPNNNNNISVIMYVKNTLDFAWECFDSPTK